MSVECVAENIRILPGLNHPFDVTTSTKHKSPPESYSIGNM